MPANTTRSISTATTAVSASHQIAHSRRAAPSPIPASPVATAAATNAPVNVTRCARRLQSSSSRMGAAAPRTIVVTANSAQLKSAARIAAAKSRPLSSVSGRRGAHFTLNQTACTSTPASQMMSTIPIAPAPSAAGPPLWKRASGLTVHAIAAAAATVISATAPGRTARRRRRSPNASAARPAHANAECQSMNRENGSNRRV